MSGSLKENTEITAKNISEYVAKYAVVYAHARDEEVQRLKKFKREQTCLVCDTIIPGRSQPGTDRNYKCSWCSQWIHESHAFYSDMSEFLCINCEKEMEKISKKCANCSGAVQFNFDLDNNEGIYCEICHEFYCGEFGTRDEGPLDMNNCCIKNDCISVWEKRWK